MSKKTQLSKKSRRVAKSPRRRPALSSNRRGAKSPAEKYEQVFEKIYKLVLKIPRGRVMTYGQIARLLEDRYSPRLVGWAMHATPQDERNIPWHRVINSKGGISTGRVIIGAPDTQRWLLEAEGVAFDERGHCDLSVYQWSPRQNKTAAPGKTESNKAARRKADASS
ncbi:MAG TPA: MGMT family protein [Blastocatellia bacterium]|nr:MGMT family protein [Blastocatellia bacterium]